MGKRFNSQLSGTAELLPEEIRREGAFKSSVSVGLVSWACVERAFTCSTSFPLFSPFSTSSVFFLLFCPQPFSMSSSLSQHLSHFCLNVLSLHPSLCLCLISFLSSSLPISPCTLSLSLLPSLRLPFTFSFPLLPSSLLSPSFPPAISLPFLLSFTLSPGKAQNVWPSYITNGIYSVTV